MSGRIILTCHDTTEALHCLQCLTVLTRQGLNSHSDVSNMWVNKLRTETLYMHKTNPQSFTLQSPVVLLCYQRFKGTCSIYLFLKRNGSHQLDAHNIIFTAVKTSLSYTHMAKLFLHLAN
jgi:hypothetical protein